ncbi:amidase [Pseudomonas sp. GV085]|uniref:amidase n=1 Tax=Pseudomonas sp. GV085 TaxID=2135756 RepID=UPI000D3C26E8|nr:amidase [Pseudomonas sp. GV085]PTR29597.1 aspartyl-tRNA(Asn)/glutamyl-tRNA(Gln) amidotransferase subunit A [Pseudomonas sp. GV085]
MKSIAQIAQDLSDGLTSSLALVDAAIDRIVEHRNAGGSAYVSVDFESARVCAIASDKARSSGAALPLLAGIPISIKDLFDVEGQVTAAGSRLLAQAEPASTDAIVVARLKAAGAILLGRTNMSEFAFSGLGLNPHFGTPVLPWDPARIAGGSSSGAAISVAGDMAVAALGTDTGGSVRIPSAFCGLTGFKPTARRVPVQGSFALSESLDSVGPLARSVEDCVLLDEVLSAERLNPVPMPLSGLRLLVTDDYVLDGLDAATASAFERTLKRLSNAGAEIVRFGFPELYELPGINAAGGLTAAEAWHLHRPWLQGPGADLYDPRVAQRIRRGESLSAYDYLELQKHRARLIACARKHLEAADAWLMPTVAITAPQLSELQANDERFFATNALVLRNPSVINFLDGCALSLPCHGAGETLPVGLSIAGLAGHDRHILSVGLSIERCLRFPLNL